MIRVEKLLRFSIVIPAHNEERYIERTLEHIGSLSYPSDAYETFVIENGSSDKTFEIAKRFESTNIHVLSSAKKSVSAAKNLGIDHLSPQSDWVIFLDADTIVEKGFLDDLNAYVNRFSDRRFVVGTTSILPLSETLNARLWFKFYDFGHRVTKTCYSISIARRSLFPLLRFDERLVMGEDLDLIARARADGKFFFLPTDAVYTSTRRFETIGWWKMLFSWVFVAVLPTRLQRRFTYKVVR